MGRVIPYTKILDLHRQVRSWSRAERRQEAQALAADPVPLAEAFSESVAEFAAGYANPDEHFLPTSTRKPLPASPSVLVDTDTVASAIFDADGGDVDRRRPDLSYVYVEREVSVLRTTGDATWDKPNGAGKAGRSLLPDLLLANRHDRTPIIGEVKVTKRGSNQTDKDHFAALVQALAAVAHLATPAQYERLRRRFPERFTEPADHRHPRLDIYLLSVGFNPEITDLQAISKATIAVSQQLVQDQRVAEHLRRIVGVDLDSAGPLTQRLSFVAEQ